MKTEVKGEVAETQVQDTQATQLSDSQMQDAQPREGDSDFVPDSETADTAKNEKGKRPKAGRSLAVAPVAILSKRQKKVQEILEDAFEFRASVSVENLTLGPTQKDALGLCRCGASGGHGSRESGKNIHGNQEPTTPKSEHAC